MHTCVLKTHYRYLASTHTMKAIKCKLGWLTSTVAVQQQGKRKHGRDNARTHPVVCAHESGSWADKHFASWMTHTIVTTAPAGSAKLTCCITTGWAGHSQKHCQFPSSMWAAPQHQTSCSSSSCTPVNTIILRRTCAAAVNNTESAGGDLIIHLTLNRSLCPPSVMQCYLATVAEQFKYQQSPGLA